MLHHVLLPSLALLFASTASGSPMTLPPDAFDALTLTHYASFPDTLHIAATRINTAFRNLPSLPRSLTPLPTPSQTASTSHLRITIPLQAPHTFSVALSDPATLSLSLFPRSRTLRNPLRAPLVVPVRLLSRPAPDFEVSLLLPSRAQPHAITLLIPRAAPAVRRALARCHESPTCLRAVAAEFCDRPPQHACRSPDCLAALAKRCALAPTVNPAAQARRKVVVPLLADKLKALLRAGVRVIFGAVSLMMIVVVAKEAGAEVASGVKEAGRRLSSRGAVMR